MLLGFLCIPPSLVLIANTLLSVGYGFQLFYLIKKRGLSMETSRNENQSKRLEKESIGVQILGFVLTVGNLGECEIPSA